MLPVLWSVRALPSQLPRTDGKRQLSPKKRGPGTRVISYPQPAASGLLIGVSLTLHNEIHELMAFIDSGAAGNFMDFTLAARLKIQPITLHDPLTVTALDGRPLGSGQVSQCTTSLHFQVGSHTEKIKFFFFFN